MGTVKYKYSLVPLVGSRLAFEYSADLDESVLEPAIESTNFSGIRKNMVPALTSPHGSEIVPRWHSDDQRVIDGFDVRILGENGGIAFTESYPVSYFSQHVRGYIKQRTDSDSEAFSLFKICAVPVDNEGACEPAGSSFSIEEIKEPLDIKEVSMECMLDSSTCSSIFEQGTANGNDIPVFITEEVISEALQVTLDAGENEAGGILIGYLCRGHSDNSPPELFVVITAQIKAPVKKEDTGKTRIRFTPDTWSYFRRAMRNRGETTLSWFHSHPFGGNKCDKGKECEKAEQCTSVFFSTADMHFQRVAFSQAYNTALVIGESACSGKDFGLYGWRKGEIVKRDFHILKKTAAELQSLFI